MILCHLTHLFNDLFIYFISLSLEKKNYSSTLPPHFFFLIIFEFTFLLSNNCLTDLIMSVYIYIYTFNKIYIYIYKS